MSTRNIKVRNDKAVPIAPAVDPGPADELSGRIEAQNLSDSDIELYDRPDLPWGEGIFVPKRATGQTLGGQYEQSVNPDPIEWFARADPVGAALVDVRVYDSRHAKVLQPRQTVVNVEAPG